MTRTRCTICKIGRYFYRFGRGTWVSPDKFSECCGRLLIHVLLTPFIHVFTWVFWGDMQRNMQANGKKPTTKLVVRSIHGVVQQSFGISTWYVLCPIEIAAYPILKIQTGIAKCQSCQRFASQSPLPQHPTHPRRLFSRAPSSLTSRCCRL